MVCNDCPRKCNLNLESEKKGFCGKLGEKIKVAKVMRHMWEEPVLVGEKGSGAIFFSNCSLKCSFCQNYEISHLGGGKDFDKNGLVDLIKKVENSGVNNINFVTPTHYTSQILECLKVYKPKVPVVWNTSGYEHNLERLKDFVDIFLFDFKYFDKNLSMKYSCVKDYFQVCLDALKKARQLQPKDEFDKNGIMKKGIIVRHLVLPGCVEDSVKIFEAIKKEIGTDIVISVMSQFIPCYKAKNDVLLNRKLKPLEYKKLLIYLEKLGFKNGFVQEFCSAKREYTPNFSNEKFFEL